jgi:hypothetical protein
LTTDDVVLGGVTPVDPAESDVQAALACALTALNAQSDSKHQLVVLSVLQATRQVVHGIKYHLLFEASLNECSRTGCITLSHSSYFSVDILVGADDSESCGIVSIDGVVISPSEPVTDTTTLATSTTAAPTTSETVILITSTLSFEGASAADFDTIAFTIVFAQYLGLEPTNVDVLASYDVIRRRSSSLVVVVLITVPLSQKASVLALISGLYSDPDFIAMILASQPNVETIASADASVDEGNSQSGSSASTGIIVGVVIGCTVAIILVILVILIVTRRRSSATAPATPGPSVSFTNPMHQTHEMMANPVYAPVKPYEPYSELNMEMNVAEA